MMQPPKIRNSPNLIRDNYSRGRWENVIDYINEMQKKPFHIPNKPGKIDSSNEYNLRIDLQGIFPDRSRPNVTWFNIQVQENRARDGAGTCTTVFTTYVHKEGHENFGKKNDHLNIHTVLQAMRQQAYHQLPECCVFIKQDGNLVSSARIPRSPAGIRKTIWTPRRR
ncbi:hypothetical protein CDV55_102799 [Aspergillus turcosus]|uniref:Uncharacterized protein n=1 Tax=Aspergillus turcosus TaxID=1245748 RepID=A0A229YQ94_9EURO|nr:hypothetical protein CDV55_102799 [Aspergillus turcosus]RLL95424.1 hypothetical protein CFD26_104027 [Aspergillus turcosus]